MDMIEPRWSKENYWMPFVAQIPGEAVLAFSPPSFAPVTFHHLSAGSYRAFLFNPSDGSEVQIGSITPDASGTWKSIEFPILREWIIVLENKA